MSDPEVVEILDVAIARLTPAEALERIEELHRKGAPALVCYANAHTLNLARRDPAYREVLRAAPLVLNDGIGVSLAARLQGRRFPANLNGSDFNPEILRLAARRGWSVFLLGAREGVAERAAANLTGSIPDLRVIGVHHGYVDDDASAAVAERISSSGAELLMVAMGNPAQELWLDRHLPATGARIGVGVGAFFDFTAGVVPRAPAWMNRVGIEWTYRLAREPRRMWKRYVVGNPLFLSRALAERLRR